MDVHNGVCAHLDAHLADRTTAGVWIVHGAPPKEGDVGVGIMSRIVHTGPVPQSCAPPTSICRRIWNALLNPENDLLLLLLPLFPHCHSSINDMLRGWEAGPRTGFIGLLNQHRTTAVPNSHGREASLLGARFCESEVLTKARLHNRGHSWQEEACAKGTEIVTRENCSSFLRSDFLVEPC